MLFTTVPLLVPAPLLAGGCASVIQEYEDRRELAMAEAGPAPGDWVADATVQLSGALIDDLMTQALQPPPVFNDEIDAGLVVLKPTLTLETLKFAPSKGCRDCLTVELGLGGQISWNAPIVGGGTAGIKVGGRLDTALAVDPTEDGFAISVAPRTIHDVGVEILGSRAAVDISGPVSKWLQGAVFDRIPKIPLTEVGSETAPVRGVRVTSSGQAVRVDLLTPSNAPGQLPAAMPFPAEGFQVDLSVASLLAMARTEAFRAGPMTRGILGEPTRMEFEGDQFILGLRLWKTTGRGFWRDYEVEGTWSIQEGQLTMTPGKVKDLGHSPGAALADPLVALAEGLIQRGIGRALDTTVPTRSGQLGTLHSELVVDKAEASGGILRLHGSLVSLPPSEGYVPGQE